MATTRAATFSAKIRTLTDFHSRISGNQQPPSNAEVITTLKYFTQTLIGFLKDISPKNGHLFVKFTADAQRSNLYPNLNYSGLFYGIVNLLDVFPLIQTGQAAIGESILDCLKALYFFLDRDTVDQLPILIASQLDVFSHDLHKKIVSLLTECILPYTLSDDCYGALSVPVVLMLVLQQHSDPSLHTCLVENLMAHKNSMYAELIAVIAKGTSEARVSAANLLFHYWPIINPHIIHRKAIQYRVHAWSTPPCQHINCADKSPAMKRIYDPVLCAKMGDSAPPMFLCKSCADDIETEDPVRYISQPMPASNSTICQNKGCESANRVAIGTCFHDDCIRSHGFVPLRLCQECLQALHSLPDKANHLVHAGLTCAWDSDIERDMVEAVVKLLKETSGQLEGQEGETKRPKWLRQLEAGQSLGKDIDNMSDERRMLSRFGIWLMSALCPPSKEAPDVGVGYIMSMLFQWFATTALLPNDSMGAALEQLKTDFASDWLNMAITNHYDVFISILNPNLPDYAQVGGVWDKLCSRKDQLKEGLSKLLSLMPYDVISMDTWNIVIANWLRVIAEPSDDEDFSELKVLLCKIFEPDLCPLPFEQKKVFEFIFNRLSTGNYNEVLDALDWLHLLCRMDIRISMDMILEMATLCLRRSHEIRPQINPEDDLDEDIGPMAVQVVMVDIIAQQMKLNEGSNELNDHKDQLFVVMALIMQYPEGTSKFDSHSCQNPEADQFSDCIRCQQAVYLYQIVMQLVEQLCPKTEIRIEVDDTNHSDWLAEAQMSESITTVSRQASNPLSPRNAISSAGQSPGAFSNFPQPQFKDFLASPQYLQATMESPAYDEFAGVLPSEEIETAFAQQVTVTERDLGHETCQVVTETVLDNLNDSPSNPTSRDNQFWDTSVGRFKFTIDQLPPQLQFVHSLLMNIERELDPDVQYFLLVILKYLCLHTGALSHAKREYRGYLIWTQENLLIPKLWGLLKSNFAQGGQIAVPLIIHAMTLPCGEDVFWNVVNKDFTSEKWEVRFKAVERIYVLAHLVPSSPVKANKLLQTCLSCAFSHLIVSVNDPNAAVAQRTLLSLQAMPSQALNLICYCLESQFDSCILDRPLIIGRIFLLTQIVPNQNFFSWDFFIQRFETLALEAQLKRQQGEHTFVQDLLHTDPMSELYQRKVTKARQSLNEACSVRSIVKSLRENSLKHQLTMSAKIEKAQEIRARRTTHLRGRRGATTGADVARIKLRKVIMMVKVVNAFRSITDRIYQFTPKPGKRSRSSTPEPGFIEQQGGPNVQQTALTAISTAFPLDSTEASTISQAAQEAGSQYGRLREFTDEESNLCLLLNRVVDMENPERHTVYITVALFVHFLSNKKQTNDEKASAKKQSVLLRHFNTLLGFSNSEKCFTIPPHRMRRAAVCNAFILGLAQILDNNMMIGNQMLPIIVQLLVHLPSPQKFASDSSTADYSLSLLSQNLRYHWLHSVILILYKYRFDALPVSDLITKLMMIVIATLECHCHVFECNATEAHTPEFEEWSDSSEESEEEKVIKEEEDDHTKMYQMAEEGVLSRPESLKMNKDLKNNQPAIIEPEAGQTPSKLLANSRRNKRKGQRKKKKLVRAECVRLSCTYCNAPIETFDEETISLCLISLSTFLHRESSMAAPLLFRIFKTVTNFIHYPMYPWNENNVFVPGNSQSVAKQLIRVIVHQFSTSGIALQLFDSKIEKPLQFWETICKSLLDFNDLNPIAFIQCLLDDMMNNWSLKLDRIFHNLSAFISFVPLDAHFSNWTSVVGQLDSFFRRYQSQIVAENNNNGNSQRRPVTTEFKSLIVIMSQVMKVQNFSTFKTSVAMVEAYGKWMTEVLHECKADLKDLLSICSICNRAMHRERDKQCLTRVIVTELVHAIKFRCELVEPNYMNIVKIILQDFGENVSDEIPDLDQYSTGGSEAIRPFLSDLLEFIADLHVLSKLKKQTNSDRMGGDLKAGLAEILALEMSRPAHRDNRTVGRFIPWLLSPPNITQAVPGAFAESVTNVRVLSWLLLGALHANQDCFPVPINCSNHMADYIHFVLAGFADQSKQSVVHMSALFHAFHLCQLWTVYCEKAAAVNEDSFHKAPENIVDFWSRVTPAILQLLAHSKVLADMVNLHFVNTIQALQQCNSATLCQLYPMWQPILTVYHSQIPSQLRIKLDACENQQPVDAQPLGPWLKKVRYKISQIELQTSAASPFYNV
uniref:Uncoordinated protein 79 n=2 Tax=Bursaphelenchus xylophilus TaxID=6326 RepID=A0A1I7SQ44_BURXY